MMLKPLEYYPRTILLVAMKAPIVAAGACEDWPSADLDWAP